MEYIQLLPNAEFIYYGEDGCVFDLFNRRNHYCKKKYVEEFKQLLNGKPYIEAELNKDLVHYIETLMDEGLVYIYNNKVFHEPFYEKSKQEIRGLFEEPPVFNNIFIQASEYCGYDCVFCKEQGHHNVNNSCETCIKWGDKKEKYDLENQITNILRILKLHHTKITFSGGNTFAAWEENRKIIEVIFNESPDTEIHIVHNGEPISKEIINDLKKYSVIINLIVFGYDSESFYKVTQNKDSYANFLSSLKVFENEKIPIKLVAIGSKENLKKIKECQFNNNDIVSCHIYDKYELDDENRFAVRMNKDTDAQFMDRKYNRCLYGKMAMTRNGLIKPCPSFSDSIVDLKYESLDSAFKRQGFDKYWRMNRKNLEICGKCPYQWNCNDCMKVVLEANQNKKEFEILCDRIKN